MSVEFTRTIEFHTRAVNMGRGPVAIQLKMWLSTACRTVPSGGVVISGAADKN